jgi:hypothetical protein
MTKLEETVTITRQVPREIADLVNFARSLGGNLQIDGLNRLSDSQLIALARDFWDTQHGED